MLPTEPVAEGGPNKVCFSVESHG